MSQQAEPAPAVVEWGTERRGRLDLLASVRWHPALPWVLAGLGAVALFGSLIGEWQVVTLDPEQFGPEAGTVTVGVGETQSWGTVWMIGALLLVAATGLAQVGQPGLRPTVRTAGLILAGGLFGLMVAAAVALNQRAVSLGGYVATLEEGIVLGLGRGVYAALASAALLGAALYVTRIPVHAAADDPPGPGAWAPPQPPGPRAAPPPADPADADPAGPADLSVAPAEPFSHVTDEQEWR